MPDVSIERPRGRQRSLIQVEPATVTEPTVAGSCFAEPAVLLSQPRLSSAPGPLPSVRGAVPDTVLDGAEIGGLSVRAASVRGDAHRYAGETRQDALAFGSADAGGTPVLIACVADGVGSKPLSHLGSSLACRQLPAALEPELPTLLDADAAGVAAAGGAAVARIADALRARTDADDVEPDAYATTLTAAVVVPESVGVRVILMRVGDSSALVLGPDGWRDCFTEPDDGMFSPKVHALPRHAEAVETTVTRLAPGEMLLLCTDGLLGPMHSDEVRDTLAGWWNVGRVPDLAAFLWQLSFRAKSFSDDRTALCVWVG